MGESFRRNLKEYFYFLKKDRNGVIIIIILIILTIGGHFIVEKIQVRPNADTLELIEAFEAWENEKKLNDQPLKFFYFNPNTISPEQLDSLFIPKFIKNNIVKYRSAGGYFKSPTDLKKIYGMNDSIYALVEPWLYFQENISEVAEKKAKPVTLQVKRKIDPNSSSAEELLLLGLNSFQVSNIEKYRLKGGRFYKPEDLLKIYGVDSNLFFAFRDNIQIEESFSSSIGDTIYVGTRIELNAADSLALIQLKGIGPVFASRIIKYRNLLGGFYSAHQLLEVYGFPEETFYDLQEDFVVDTTGIKKVRINFAEYTDLIRHPYIEKEHVEAVLSYRNKNGALLSNEQLLIEGLIDSATYRRVRPYITCR